MNLLNKQQLIDLLLIVNVETDLHPYLRVGQSFFNNLVGYYPEYDWIRGTQLDPFHNVKNMNKLIAEICDIEAYFYWQSLKNEDED